MRVLIDRDPSLDFTVHLHESSPWPAKWIGHPEHSEPTASVVIAYRRRFTLDKPAKVRIHVSADERYELFVDGRREGRGPERGDRQNWFYETYDLDLPAGEHAIVARTWWLGPQAPSAYAQIGVRPGFFLMAEGEHNALLSTGVADWQCKRLGGYSFERPTMPHSFMVVGGRTRLKGEAFDWGFHTGAGEGWGPTKVLAGAAVKALVAENPPEWVLRPAVLPPMIERPVRAGKVRHAQPTKVPLGEMHTVVVRKAEHDEKLAAAWDAMLRGEAPVQVPANSAVRVIVDLENYYCAFPELTLSGGKDAVASVRWAESLYEDAPAHRKGHRDEVEGKVFVGIGDTFEPAGGAEPRVFEPLWWEAGRYVQFHVTTADEPLTVHAFGLRETHYPFEWQGKFESSDNQLADVIPIALRTVEMCGHETYMDCPFYEQLMYVGDTRLEALTTYAATQDDRLPRKALLLFDESRLPTGMTQARYPTRIDQVIPTFSLWYVSMAHDYMMWRGDPAVVKERMRAVRAITDAFVQQINDDGLVVSPAGWMFVDWVPGWRSGCAPEAQGGINGIVNFQTAMTLRQAAEMEAFVGEPESAARLRRHADRITAAAQQAFWDEGRGLYAEDRARQHFSEHAQCLALIGDSVPAERRERLVNALMTDEKLYRTTIYFTHCLFEACRLTGRMDKLFERLQLWFELRPRGFKTTFEMPEPTRSDCHAWGAHAVFHYFATVLGIRPASPGFKSVRVEPQFGPLKWARGRVAHPHGVIDADLHRNGDEKLAGEIQLPDGVTGTLVYRGKELKLKPGRQSVTL